MNRLQQIEQEVLAAGREWTRALLEKRLQEECLAVEMVSAKTGEELEIRMALGLGPANRVSFSCGIGCGGRSRDSDGAGQVQKVIVPELLEQAQMVVKTASIWGSTIRF